MRDPTPPRLMFWGGGRGFSRSGSGGGLRPTLFPKGRRGEKRRATVVLDGRKRGHDNRRQLGERDAGCRRKGRERRAKESRLKTRNRPREEKLDSHLCARPLSFRVKGMPAGPLFLKRSLVTASLRRVRTPRKEKKRGNGPPRGGSILWGKSCNEPKGRSEAARGGTF